MVPAYIIKLMCVIFCITKLPILSILEVAIPMEKETPTTTELSLLEKVANALEEVGREFDVGT